MLLSFFKYSGCGNDFILFDNRKLIFPSDCSRIITKLCHRQHGIGADGVILLEYSTHSAYKMRIFNSNGSEAEMCGNGIRCLFKFMQQCGIQGKQQTIETLSGVLSVESEGNDVAVEMGSPREIQWSLPLSPWVVHHLNTGVPHAVIFSNDIENLSLAEWGPQIRFHKLFAPRGTNVNFAQIAGNGIIHLRTYERGVEQETLACGTGATATALAAAKIYGLQAPVSVKVRSGDILKIDFELHGDAFKNVRMIGPAHHVFSGTISVN